MARHEIEEGIADEAHLRIADHRAHGVHARIGKRAGTRSLPSNGAWLASGSDDSTIKLWDIAGGRLLRTLTGHSNQIKAIALTADGRTLISLSADNTIKVWEAQTGRELRPSLF
jgi:WD40 repeat protein